MRIPAKYLEHEVLIERLLRVPSSTSGKYGPPARVACLVVEKTKLVRDQRVQSEGSTRDADVTSSAQILFQPESRVPVGSLVTIWPGTSNERKVQIVSDAFAQHSIAPSSWQAWTE
jgi:hypothetical protein